MTSGAGYTEAPRYFRINPQNYSGRRLYRLVGSNHLIVTNACRELVSGPEKHGKPDSVWLQENLRIIDKFGPIDVLLICGKVAQRTYAQCRFIAPLEIEMPHPAARAVWTKERIEALSIKIQS